MSNLDTNGHRPQPRGVVDLGQVAQEARLRRTKLVVVPPPFVATLLQMDGSFALKMTGWPEGAEVVGAGMVPAGFALVLYRADWPLRLNGIEPECLQISYTRVPPLDEAPQEAEA